MRTPKLQSHKVRHLLDRNGINYPFRRAVLDKYNQPVLDDEGNRVYETIHTVRGIYHEQGSSFSLIINDAASVQTKPTPSILAMLEVTQSLEVNDIVSVPPESGRVYKVVSVNDIGNLGLFADISLEVILDGLPV